MSCAEEASDGCVANGSEGWFGRVFTEMPVLKMRCGMDEGGIRIVIEPADRLSLYVVCPIEEDVHRFLKKYHESMSMYINF